YIHGLRARGAQPAHRAVFQDFEELRLERGGERPDLVEKQHALMRELEEPGLGLVRARESATLVPEELGFEQVFGNCRAVEVDERRLGARPRTMDRPRHEPFARARLPTEEK